MTKKIYQLLTIMLLAMVSLYAAPQQPTIQLQSSKISKEDMLKISETFGNFIGKNLKAPGIDLNLDQVIIGLRKGVEGKPAPLTDQEFETLMAVVQAQAFTEISDKNLKEANEFLEKNKSKSGVVSLESNKLQYEVLKPGTGKTVENTDSPLINYKGSYINGTVFGNSVDAGGPVTIPLDQTVPGFAKGIAGMKEGEKRQLYIHPDLGYGTTGALQPNALLIFEVEVVEANHKNDSAPATPENK